MCVEVCVVVLHKPGVQVVSFQYHFGLESLTSITGDYEGEA